MRLILLIAVISLAVNIEAEIFDFPSFINEIITNSRNHRIDEVQCLEGYRCLSCHESEYCIQLPNGDFLSGVVECRENQACDTDSGVCVEDPTSQCEASRLFEFECDQIGMFPHPFDCTKYYYCDVNAMGNVTTTEKTCDPGTEYEPLTTFCNRIRTGSCIPLANCDRMGAIGRIADHPYMYYACLPTTINGTVYALPKIYVCRPGELFIDGACRSPIPPIGIEDGLCSDDGHFSVENDCESFNRCYAGTVPILLNCGSNTYFDPWKQICVPYECPKLPLI